MDDELMALADVEAVTALKKSSIYARVSARTFPQPTKIGSATRWLACTRFR
ncbi:MAG: AlpA family phage regulatory protein [Pseudolabrys sp.]|nr:AlpA family phage regulatory protein [Pseudolabrys sp.]